MASFIGTSAREHFPLLVKTPEDDDEIAKVLDFGIAKMSSTPG